MRIVLLTSQNNNICYKMIKQVVTQIPGCNVDVYFEKLKRTKKSKIQRQINNIKKNGLMWIPYRLVVAAANMFKWKTANNDDPTLFGNIAKLDRVNLKIVPSYDSKELWQEIDQNKYDLGIVFGTGIIKKGLFTLPKKGMINIHQGMTQFYRGQPPAFWELYNNERETGITIHKVTEKLDGGDILFQKSISIQPNDSLKILQRKLNHLVIENIPEVVKDVLEDNVSIKPVDLSRGRTYTKPTLKEIRELKKRLRNRKYTD